MCLFVCLFVRNLFVCLIWDSCTLAVVHVHMGAHTVIPSARKAAEYFLQMNYIPAAPMLAAVAVMLIAITLPASNVIPLT